MGIADGALTVHGGRPSGHDGESRERGEGSAAGSSSGVDGPGEGPGNADGIRIVFVHEFPPQANERMMESLMVAMGRLEPRLRPMWCTGFLGTYRPGGVRFMRLLNMGYVFAVLPFRLWRGRPRWVVTVTTPPMVQVWLAWWCGVTRSRLICWLMDYHPEIEARVLEGSKLTTWAARALRKLDAWTWDRTSLVVALDRAMAREVKRKSSSVQVIVHPTWDTQGQQAPGRVPFFAESELTLFHAGNLGVAHDPAPLEKMLGLLGGMGITVKLVVTGGSLAGNRRFQEMAARFGCALELRSRVPFGELRSLCEHHRVQVGIVLMRSEMAGLVSPSKFSGYLKLGLPILYFGPVGTNADFACRDLGAGLAIPPDSSATEWSSSASRLASVEDRRRWWESVPAAADYFGDHNEDSLARRLLEHIEERSKPGYGR